MRKLLSFFASICLAITFLAAGLGICAGIPQVTYALADAYSNDAVSPYAHDELVQLACKTRDFTVLDYGRAGDGEAAATQAIEDRIAAVADEPYQTTDSRRFLDEESLSHLNDVNAVISTAFWVLLIIACAAVALLIFSFVRYGKHFGANILLASGIGMLAVMVVLALWALIGFDAFFAAFHSLFFAEGTWTFAYDSLLICMYPIEFWIGMAAIWAGTTIALSAAAIVVGLALRLDRPVARGNNFGDQLA